MTPLYVQLHEPGGQAIPVDRQPLIHGSAMRFPPMPRQVAVGQVTIWDQPVGGLRIYPPIPLAAFDVVEKGHTFHLTELGITTAQRWAGGPPLGLGPPPDTAFKIA